MNNIDNIIRMRNQFVLYLTLIGQNGPSWKLDFSENDAGQHILVAIRTAKLRYRLESSMTFIRTHGKQMFEKFFKHSQKIADSFALLNNGV